MATPSKIRLKDGSEHEPHPNVWDAMIEEASKDREWAEGMRDIKADPRVRAVVAQMLEGTMDALVQKKYVSLHHRAHQRDRGMVVDVMALAKWERLKGRKSHG